MHKEKIMIVEDEMIIAEDIRKIVQICGYHVCCMARSGEDAIKKAIEIKPDLVLMDIMLESEMSGLDAAHEINRNLNIPFVFVSAYADDKTLQKAIQTEPYGYIVKPFEEKELKVILELALYKFRMENILKKSQEKYLHIFENIQDIYCEFDLEMNILEISPSIKEYTGLSRNELIGKPITELFNDNQQIIKLSEEVKKRGFINDFEIQINSKNSKKVIGSIQGKIVSQNDVDKEKIVFAIRDITKQKEMEKQIIQTERLAGVGQLAAGIAHEIRNPLGNISSAIQFCLEKYKPKEPLNQYLQIVLRNSESANQIIKELLEFANPRDIKLQNEAIKKILDKAVGLTQTRCEEKNVVINRKYDNTEVRIPVDEKWIQQCFVNFILNSIDAIESEGEITISVNDFIDYIQIEFQDNGAGISQENIKKVFDPFFTTKSDGTGLGMAMVLQIILAHDGNVDIESEEGVGTNVFVKLPKLTFNNI